MASSKEAGSAKDRKIAKIKNGKAAKGGGKHENGGGQSGSMAKGGGDTSGSRGTGHSV